MSATEAHELALYIDNDGNLYERMTTGILRNLVSKKASGQYKHDLAVKAFGYLTEAGAKKYVKEHGAPNDPWHKIFDASTRAKAAEELAKDFERRYALGEYNWLLSGKKLKQGAPSHARKKSNPYAPIPRSKGGFDARVNTTLMTKAPKASEKSGRVEILESGDSNYFRPGQFGYVVGSSVHGGNHTLDRGVSSPGELTYLVSKKPKGAGGGAPWFSSGALRFTDRGGASGHARRINLVPEKTRQPASDRGAQGFSSNNQNGTVSFNGRVIAARTSRGWTPTGAASDPIARALNATIFAFPDDISADDLRRRVTDILESDQTTSGVGRSDHARRKQLDREILQVVPSYRWRQ